MRHFALFSLMVVVVAAGCSRSEAPPRNEQPRVSSSGVVAPMTASAPATPSIDAPSTKKEAEGGLSITFLSATTGPNENASAFVVMAFAIDDTSGKERPISAALSIQVTEPSGVSAKLDSLKSRCDGIVPPKGRLACLLKYDFPTSPTELSVRVEGAWFHVRVERRDGGK